MRRKPIKKPVVVVDAATVPCTHSQEGYKMLGPTGDGEAEIMFCPQCQSRNAKTGLLMEGRLFRVRYVDIESLAPLSFTIST
jgi:hypothetical protein